MSDSARASGTVNTPAEPLPVSAEKGADTIGFIRQVTSFFVGSCLGLVVDLGVFAALHQSTALPAWSLNFISSATAVTVTYAFVTKYAFGRKRRLRSYVLFFGWYALSIVIFSIVIELISSALDVDAFIAKLISLPLSFSVNFVFSRLLFSSRLGGGPGAQR